MLSACFRSKSSRILAGRQCRHFSTETCRQHILWSNKKMENSLERKNYWGKFCTKMPLVPTGQEFGPECNVAIFARKLVDSIFIGLRNKCKTIMKNN